MAKPETQYIAKIHKLLPGSVYRMKNHNIYTGGVADCWYSGRAGDLWVEYKYEPKLPVTRWITPSLSALQVKWLRERYDEGRNVAVIVGCGAKGLLLTCPEDWRREFSPQEFTSSLKPNAEIADWIQQCVSSQITSLKQPASPKRCTV